MGEGRWLSNGKTKKKKFMRKKKHLFHIMQTA